MESMKKTEQYRDGIFAFLTKQTEDKTVDHLLFNIIINKQFPYSFQSVKEESFP